MHWIAVINVKRNICIELGQRIYFHYVMQFKNVLELLLYHTGYIYGQMVDKKKSFRAAAVKQIEKNAFTRNIQGQSTVYKQP